ncbi:hypothetical protein [Prosthecobacter debontii]|nr:hypothetical protein [Prosthecobacter debontii]
MAALDSDSPTASAPLQELLFPPEGAESPSLPLLPVELGNAARALEKAMADPMQVSAAYSNFCAAAYVKPEWAGAASDYLTTLFAEREDVLAEMTRVPDLIIELASGHYTLTFLVASHWAEKADLARLTRLGEALVATQSKMNCPEVVELMMALTTSLAISRYSRAEQLLAAAEASAGADQQEALAEARLWLDAGRSVRACSQEVRDLWDYRLRRSRTAWSWSSPQESDALAQLAECLDPATLSAELFKAVVPKCWWDLFIKHHQDMAEAAAVQSNLRSPSSPPPLLETAHEPKQPIIRRQVVIWRAIPFFIGGLVGAWALVMGIWLGPFDLVRPSTDGDRMVTPRSAADGKASEGVMAKPDHPNAVWRQQQATLIADENPDFRRLAEKLESGGWARHETLLRGQTAELPQEDPAYQKFLLWLHLDPPSDPEIRSQIPLLLAELRQDSTIIELWEKLIYSGSPNAKDIQEAALRTQHDKKEEWSPTQRAALTKIAAAAVP